MQIKKLKHRIQAVALSATLALSGVVSAPFMTSTAAETVGSSNTNYARLVQYSLYFFDANMCGNISSKCALSWRSNCHTYDSSISSPTGNADLSGGYHDAGDHVKFNLPGAFSFITLGMAYKEFPSAYKNTGQEAHLKVIQDHFADYFRRCTKMSGGKVDWYCYQVGDGNADHNYWGAPENQPASAGHNKAYFVEKGKPGADQVAAAAAGLALNYINFKNQADLDTAKALYSFMKNDVSKAVATDGCSSFYSMSSTGDANMTAYMQLAAMLLAEATGDQSYKSDASAAVYGWCYNWSTPAVYLNVLKGDMAKVSSNSFGLATKQSDGYYYLQQWGSARYNCGMQIAGLLADKYNNSNQYSDEARKQMDMILGNNTWNNGQSVSLVGCWANNSVKALHHRAADGTTQSPGKSLTGRGDANTRANKNTMPGALAGGPYPIDGQFQHIDAINDFVGNEVAMDYNANFAAAAAGLYAKFPGGTVDSSVPGVGGVTYTTEATTVTTQQPTTQYQPPTTQSQPPTTQYQPPTTQYQPPTTQYQPPTTQPPTSSNVLYGDANCDGIVRIEDVILVRLWLLAPNRYYISSQGMINADCVNPGDGVKLADATAIQESLVDLVKLPIGNVIVTTPPVYTTAAPVYTTAAPVYTTAAPVYTTAAPVYTTAAAPSGGSKTLNVTLNRDSEDDKKTRVDLEGLFTQGQTVKSISFELSANGPIGTFVGGYGFSVAQGTPLFNPDYWYGNYGSNGVNPIDQTFSGSSGTLTINFTADQGNSISAMGNFELGMWWSDQALVKVTKVTVVTG